MTTLTLDRLTKAYRRPGQAAVRDLSLAVESGSLTVLLGPSGSGKSTLMKLIAGLLAPDLGDVLLDGQPITALSPERRGIAMVFQNPLLFPHLTVAGNIGFGLRMRGLSPAEIAAWVDPMLARVRLEGLGPRRPVELSGGQQQRAALARALVLKPKVLLLDEPLSNLDPALREDMQALIRTLQRETGITTLVVTHDQSEAVALADQIALLLDGALAQHGAPRDFYNRPATEAVARFFGGVNFLPGRSQGGQFLSTIGRLELPEGAPEGDQLLTIRPEAVRLTPGPNPRLAKVTDITFLGTQTRVALSVSGVPIHALTTPDQTATLRTGSEIDISLPPDALWLLPPAGSTKGG